MKFNFSGEADSESFKTPQYNQAAQGKDLIAQLKEALPEIVSFVPGLINKGSTGEMAGG